METDTTCNAAKEVKRKEKAAARDHEDTPCHRQAVWQGSAEAGG